MILNTLYKLTPMQTTFGIILLAIVDNQPKVMTLLELLGHFLDHRKTVVIRRTRFDLRKAEERAHLLEGILKALDHLDEVIATIRASHDPGRGPRAADGRRSRSPTSRRRRSSRCACSSSPASSARRWWRSTAS